MGPLSWPHKPSRTQGWKRPSVGLREAPCRRSWGGGLCVSWAPSSPQTATPQDSPRSPSRLSLYFRLPRTRLIRDFDFSRRPLGAEIPASPPVSLKYWVLVLGRPGYKAENWNSIKALWVDGRVWDRHRIKYSFVFPLSEQSIQSCCNFPFLFFQGDGLDSVSFALVVHINKDEATWQRRGGKSQQLFIYRKHTCTKSHRPLRMLFMWALLPKEACLSLENLLYSWAVAGPAGEWASGHD